MRNRRVAITALALVLALSGCSFTNTLGSAADEASLSTDLDELSVELQEIDGVDAVLNSLKIQPDLSYLVGVTIITKGLDEEAAEKVINAVTRTYVDGKFPEQPQLSLTIGAGDDTPPDFYLQNWNTFPHAAFSAEIPYFYDLQEAFGAPLSMELGTLEGEEEGYYRSISATHVSPDADWDAMRAITPTLADAQSWAFGTIDMTQTLVPVELDALVEDVAALPSTFLTWNGVTFSFDLFVVPAVLATDGEFSTLEEWPAAVDLLSSDAARGLSQFSIAEDGRSAVVHKGDCGELEVTDSEKALAAQLATEGLEFEPGNCISY
jgi:hypothetical protein